MSTGMLGIDIALFDPASAQEAIVKSCVQTWFQTNPSGLHNWGDCSGFVKAVQKDLHLQPFVGDANSIYDEVERRSDWIVLGSGSQALAEAGRAANAGQLTIGVWKNPKGHGHVAIVTAFLPMLGHKAEHHAIAAWGQFGKVGALFDRMSKSFGSNKHADIRYARCIHRPVLFG